MKYIVQLTELNLYRSKSFFLQIARKKTQNFCLEAALIFDCYIATMIISCLPGVMFLSLVAFMTTNYLHEEYRLSGECPTWESF